MSTTTTTVLGRSSITAGTLVPLRPTALAVGTNGDLYIADQIADRILERQPDGTFSVIAGIGMVGFSGDGGPATNAELDRPGAMTAAPDGTLYFVDESNDRVRAVSPAGTISTVVGGGGESSATGFVSSGTPAFGAAITPDALTLGPGGRLYIATSEQVLRLESNGTLMVVAGAKGAYQGAFGVGGPAVGASVDGANAIAFDGAGYLYIAGFNTKALLVVTPGGTLTSPLAEPFYPRGAGGVVSTPSGGVVAMDGQSVVSLTPTGTRAITTFFPGTFHGIRGFEPNGIAVAPDGAIYVDTFRGNGYVDRSAIASIGPDGSTSQILWQSTDEPLFDLAGNGINAALFGDAESNVTAMFDLLLGQPTTTMTLRNPGNCGIEAAKRWGEVTVFFSHGQLVGYTALGSTTRYTSGGGFYFGGSGRQAETELGLRVGYTLAMAQELYRYVFKTTLTTSAAQGGVWIVTEPDGILHGYLSGEVGRVPPSQLVIESIGAGEVGCPADTP